MTIVVDVAIVGLGLVVGRWVSRSLRRRGAATRDLGPQVPEAGPNLLEPFPCAVGDVVVRTIQRDEAWLAGALVFSESAPVAVLFVAPEAGGDRGVYLRRDAPRELLWLAPAAAAPVGATCEPPHTLEHEGRAYARARRLPVKAARLGTGAPDLGDELVVAEYEGPGPLRLLVATSPAGSRAWSGEVVRLDDVEVLPGARALPSAGA